MNKPVARVILMGWVLSLLGACATQNSFDGTVFLDPPEDISSSWIDSSGQLTMVPARGVVVDEVLDQTRRRVSFSQSGPYLVIPHDAVQRYAGSALWLRIEGKLRRLEVPGIPGDSYTEVGK